MLQKTEGAIKNGQWTQDTENKNNTENLTEQQNRLHQKTGVNPDVQKG